MTDRRELILARLLAIGEAMSPATFVTVVRNRGLLKDEQRPAFALLDGGELSRSDQTRKSRGGSFTPSVRLMRPEFWILAKETRPTGLGPGLTDGENIGTTVNALRAKLLKAIEQDSELFSLIGANGEIVLDDLETDLVSGGAMSGEMKFTIGIAYPMDPSAL